MKPKGFGIMARTGGTLLEVAKRCSVSQSTVSRVLNNSKHGRFSVSPAVREKILTAARELNYRPSVAARNLTVSKTRLVAVLGVRTIGSDAVGPMERAVIALAKALDAAGYEICLQFLSKRHNWLNKRSHTLIHILLRVWLGYSRKFSFNKQ